MIFFLNTLKMKEIAKPYYRHHDVLQLLQVKHNGVDVGVSVL